MSGCSDPVGSRGQCVTPSPRGRPWGAGNDFDLDPGGGNSVSWTLCDSVLLCVCPLHFTCPPPRPHPHPRSPARPPPRSHTSSPAADSLLSTRGGNCCSVPLCLFAGRASAFSILLATPSLPLLPPHSPARLQALEEPEQARSSLVCVCWAGGQAFPTDRRALGTAHGDQVRPGSSPRRSR